MSPEEFRPRAGRYAGLVERFLLGRPVEIVLGKPVEQACAGFYDGKLHLFLVSDAAHMLAHELGHVVEATPDELFMPNLGLVADGATPAQHTAEARVVAWHIVLNGAQCNKPGGHRERLTRVGELMFGTRSSLGRQEWRATLDRNIETFTLDMFAERWEQVWQTIDARAAVAA